MESKIGELLSPRSQEKLEQFSQVPGAATPWPNPIEVFDLLSPSTEKENALVSLISTAMLHFPENRGEILSLAQEHWGTPLLEADSIIPNSHFPIHQVHVPEARESMCQLILSSRGEVEEKVITSARRLQSLLEQSLGDINYVNNYRSRNISTDGSLCFPWLSIVIRNPESFLSKWLREQGYEAGEPLEQDSPLEIFGSTLMEWNGHINTWRGEVDGEPPLPVVAIYNRRSISPLNLLELRLLTEEYNEEWATAVF